LQFGGGKQADTMASSIFKQLQFVDSKFNRNREQGTGNCGPKHLGMGVRQNTPAGNQSTRRIIILIFSPLIAPNILFLPTTHIN
jgi:hypothetical protein